MKKLGLHEIRKEFLSFFQEKEHLVLPSFSLVPKNDKSLLLINAGMAPLKPYFTGIEEPPKRRVVTCQKCVRTGDIENVGKTARHATFFEMLGNFSFGDYFKKESIKWAWEFMTERLEIPVEKLWISIYKDDDEAYEIWNKEIGVSEDKIVRLGKDDNFWELEIGPCGPCSEIYVDRGAEYGCENEDCKPGCDCDRYVEVWNLVFSQYDKDEKGNYNPLPNPNIDTGMGLERITVVLQDADNIFEIEPIKSIVKRVEKICQVKYGTDNKTDVSIRIITDHIRAITFMVSDGIIPSNEGRGYVLRRLIRRAARHGKLIGIKENFLYDLVDEVIKGWKEIYPELSEKREQIRKIVKIEEEKFEETIDQGINILKEHIEKLKKEKTNILDGNTAFKLYDTYGFPLELTKEILEEEGIKVDEEGFNTEMEKQRERARKAREKEDKNAWKLDFTAELGNLKTNFIGYDKLVSNSKVLALINNEETVDELVEGNNGIIILDKTPFYPEGGGQIGDIGTIENDEFKAIVNDTKKENENLILHYVKVLEGKISVNDLVKANVNVEKRKNTARNHSATHLLHKTLKDVLGSHVNQAGSLVEPNRLRFDFTHFEGISKDELNKIEDIVNKKILEGLNVEAIETSLDEAKKMGATALFDEKYAEDVRVIKMGDYSMELCGGTHVKNTSEIGLFKIISESGISSGVRRIEAITGKMLYEYLLDINEKLEKLTRILKTNEKDIVDRVEILNKENKVLQKEVDRLKSKLASSKIDDIIKEAKEILGIKVISKKIEGMDANSLRDLGDKIKNKMDSVLVVLGTVNNGKVLFISMASKDLVSKGIHAGNIIREVAKITKGGGGGRPDMAQAGGKDPSMLDKALNSVENIVKCQIKA
ncbi:alanine--tRNA ligase [Thermohalobacter berrensis]|uniref:Alanine--tRNA ligase n=1 Tax=Thermohalobacter berrensis TaxID=99594 RepID=A0A419TAZ1_9FIRM|nr:alanine--tRNA ligase [Thermohalobacter berrensis]RKD34617.1 alanine--tRNA ligase [Thermohalobacter berrensis]